MIVVDIECSGPFPIAKYGIWQIGAIDLLNPNNQFLQEGKIDSKDETEPSALMVTGKSEESLRDPEKQSQEQLLKNFFEWVKKTKIKNFICQNTPFDISYLTEKGHKYGLKIPFHYRSFDLHGLAQLRFHQLNEEFSIEGDHSNMNLKKILEFCGLEDPRIQIKDGKKIGEGNPHNALEDCKLEGECFSRIVYGKSFFPEFTNLPIPEYLKK
jgi:DNA polymerase III epsilon subunit-like protein